MEWGETGLEIEKSQKDRLGWTEATYWEINWGLSWIIGSIQSRTNRLRGRGSRQRDFDFNCRLFKGPWIGMCWHENHVYNRFTWFTWQFYKLWPVVNPQRASWSEYPFLHATQEWTSLLGKTKDGETLLMYAYHVPGGVLDFFSAGLLSLSFPPCLTHLHMHTPKYLLTRTWLTFPVHQFLVKLLIKVSFKIPVNIRPLIHRKSPEPLTSWADLIEQRNENIPIFGWWPSFKRENVISWAAWKKLSLNIFMKLKQHRK